MIAALKTSSPAARYSSNRKQIDSLRRALGWSGLAQNDNVPANVEELLTFQAAELSDLQRAVACMAVVGDISSRYGEDVASDAASLALRGDLAGAIAKARQ